MSKTRKAKKTTRVDWSLVPRGPVSGAAVGAAALAATGAVGGVADVSPLIAAAGAGVGALGSVLEAAHRQGGPGALLYRLGAWVGAGGWLTWAWSSDAALSANGLAALGAGAVGAATLAPLGRIRPAERRAAQAGELVPVAGDVALRSLQG